MRRVINAVENIKKISGARVDCSFGQGHKAMLEHLHNYNNKQYEDATVENYSKKLQLEIETVVDWVKPFELPQDYLFFLQYYGGLAIENSRYNLWINGIGLMVEGWYPFLSGDFSWTKPSVDKVLTLGDFESKQEFSFLLDLAEVIKHNSIVVIGPTTGKKSVIQEVVKNFPDKKTGWRIIANSFTEWLESVPEIERDLN